jgi:hypothetical protein
VNIEYSLNGDRELHDVAVIIPLGTAEPPHIENIDGNSHHDARYGSNWEIKNVESERRGGVVRS